MMRLISLLIVFELLCVSCAKDEDHNHDINTAELIDEVYDVYNAIVGPLGAIHLIKNKTDTNQNCSIYLDINEYDTEVTQEIVNECIEKNKVSYTLDTDKLQSGGIILISREGLDSYESFSKALEVNSAIGLFEFGCPVFYSNGEKAMVETSYICGGLCGNGAIVLLENKDDKWVIKQNYPTWISK